MKTYTVKVALRGVSPMIWRRFSIAANTSLACLHCIIQIDLVDLKDVSAWQKSNKQLLSVIRR